MRPADAAEAARIAQVIRSAFGQYGSVLEPPSGALAVDAAAVRDLMMELGGISRRLSIDHLGSAP